jgi:hypothetical protein
MTTSRPLIVEVLWGPSQGRKAVVPVGGSASVGRGEQASLRVEQDEKLAPLHLEIGWDGERARVRALVKEETCLGGQPIREAFAEHGGWIRAGATDLALAIEKHTPPDPAPPPDRRTTAAPVLGALRALPGRVFALLDAARSERIRVLLRESPWPYRSLYDGAQGDTLFEAAPYLVELPPASELLKDLVLEGWGEPWGVWLSATMDRDMEAVRRHLRKFLMVELGGERVYFRFYDPRVLAAYVPTCTAGERRELLGGMAWHVVDARAQNLLSFRS